MTVMWETTVPAYCWVEYGTDTTQLKRARTIVDGQVVCNNKLHKIRLDDLQPGQKYYYRVCSQAVSYTHLAGKDKLVTTSVGEKFIAPALIIATGASWRKLNVPGENDYIGRGVAFCPHCDGPFYKGKQVAVVGLSLIHMPYVPCSFLPVAGKRVPCAGKHSGSGHRWRSSLVPAFRLLWSRLLSGNRRVPAYKVHPGGEQSDLCPDSR